MIRLNVAQDKPVELEVLMTTAAAPGPAPVLINKTITENGVYAASADGADGYRQVTAEVPNTYTASDEGKVVENGALEPQTAKTITANGTYDTTKNNSVTAAVPNTYSAADEGKVVDNGALVSQTAKTITANGTYDTTKNNSVTAEVPNTYTAADEGKVVDEGALVSQTALSITSNGTYDTTKNNSVTASVPNTYTAADEGKVVDNGDLVAQTSATYTVNDTYDTTLINEVVVNVTSGGISADDIADGTALTGAIILETATTIKEYAFRQFSGITSIHAKNLDTIGQYIATNGLQTFVSEKYTTGGAYNIFSGVGNSLQAVDFNHAAFSNGTFTGCSNFTILVLRRTGAITACNGLNAFNNTPFASGGTGGTVYVPDDLITSYQAAANWSTILGYANNQIKSIESTHTDPTAPIDLTLYYVDGTPIS